DVVAVQKLERGFAHGVVPAGKGSYLMVQAELFESQDYFFREFGQECRVVPAVNQQRFLFFLRESLNVAGRGDRGRARTRAFQIDGRFHVLPDVLGGKPGPYDVGELRGAMVEDVHRQAIVVRAGEERVGGSEARADDAELFVTLLLEPVEAGAHVDHGLARGVDGPGDVR